MADNFRQDPLGLEVEPNDADEVPQIFIAMPNLGETTVMNLPIMARWIGEAYQLEKWNLKLFFPCDHVPPSKARNKIHKEFINSKYDYLFTLDSDVVPPPNALDILLHYLNDDETERHWVALTVQMSKMTQKGAMLAPSAFNYDEDAGGFVVAQGDGLTQCDVANLACTMRTRELMEAVGPGVYAEWQHGEFADSTTGEDFVFGERVMDLVEEGHEEYKPWIDYNTICSHYVTMNTRAMNDLLVRAEDWKEKEVTQDAITEPSGK